MKEKLFNFITVRNISKSGIPTQNKGKIVIDTRVETILKSNKNIAEKKEDLKSYERTLGTLSIIDRSPALHKFLTLLIEKKFNITTEDAKTLMERAFEKRSQLILEDATLKKQFEFIKTHFSVGFLTSSMKKMNELVVAIKAIILVEELCNGRLKPLENIQSIFQSTLLLPEYYSDYLNEISAVKVEKRPIFPRTKSKEYIKLETNLESINSALKEITIKSPKEIKIELRKPIANNRTKIVPPRVMKFFTQYKKDLFSPNTLSLIGAEGLVMDDLNYDDTHSAFVKRKLEIQNELDNMAAPSSLLPNRVFWNGTLFNVEDLDLFKPNYAKGDLLLKPWNPYMRPLGIGELKTVEQVNIHYEAGEIAHIENVLKGEKKERIHVRNTSSKTETEIENFNEKSTEHELETTSRHELSTESQKIVKEELNFDFKMHTDSTFGPWLELQTDTSLGYNHSKEESKNVSSNYAKETVEKAAERIRESTREKKILTVTNQTTETNSHALDNIAGTGHVVGIYRWIDKVYTAQVRTHDVRMLYEFIIPEPAAYYIHSNLENPKHQFALNEPEIPLRPDGMHPLNHAYIDEYNYLKYARKYNVSNLNPPPVKELVFTKSYIKKLTDDESNKHIASLDFNLPEGYSPEMITGAGVLHPEGNQKLNVIFSIGNENIYADGLSFENGSHDNTFTLAANLEFDPVPSQIPFTPVDKLSISMFAYNASLISMVLELHCTRRYELYERWQVDVYEKIMAGYQNLKNEYDDKLTGMEYSQGIKISGNNPLRNEDIQKTELKKHCISFMTMTYLDKYDSIIRVLPAQDSTEGIPEIDFEKADRTALEIQFFEQAFEWPQMMYRYYPYFWSKKANWTNKMSIDPSDPQFGEFMRAGSARVILAVKRGYEEVVAHYFQTGEILEGVHHIGINNSLYQDIIDELKNEQSNSLGEVIDQWDVRLPTNLIVIDDDDAIKRIGRILNSQPNE